MATTKQIEANQHNALKSTGPKTEAGKAAVRRNAVKHGATASAVVIPFLECEADWEAHRQGTLDSLKPFGHLETVLAERVAMLLWRLGRATRYEREMIATQQESLEANHFKYDKTYKSLAEIREKLKFWQNVRKLARNLLRLDNKQPLEQDLAYQVVNIALIRIDEADRAEVLKNELPAGMALDEFAEWTPKLLCKALADIASQADEQAWNGKWTVKELLEVAEEVASAGIKAVETALQSALTEIEKQRRVNLVAEESTLNKVTRYEAQLERSLYKALHELQRMQAPRKTENGQFPALIEVDLNLNALKLIEQPGIGFVLQISFAGQQFPALDC